LVELITRAKESGDYGALLDAVPYVKWLGIGGMLLEGEPISTLHFREDLIGNPVLPALHGGTIGALLESAATFRLFWEAETVVLPRIINLTVAYLRPGRPVETYAQRGDREARPARGHRAGRGVAGGSQTAHRERDRESLDRPAGVTCSLSA
jgi:acyl-coenzyme A thioesterase PaaI-like protein